MGELLRLAVDPALEATLRRAATLTGLLHIDVPDPQLSALPWEAVPDALQLRDMLTVRLSTFPRTTAAVANSGMVGSDPSGKKADVLVAAFPEKQGLRDAITIREALGSDAVQIVQTGAEAANRLLTPARYVHVVAASIVSPLDAPRFPLGSDDDFDEEMESSAAASWTSLLARVSSPQDVAAVLINSPRSGHAACRLACEGGIPLAIGWPGWVDEDRKAAFVRFFYKRIFERKSAAEAWRLYLTTSLRDAPYRALEGPTLWLGEPLSSANQGKSSSGSHRVDEIFRGGDPRDLGGFRPQEARTTLRADVRALNPALLRNGEAALPKVIVHSRKLEGPARLQIECDTGHRTSTHVQQVQLLDGEQQIDTSMAKFPCLDDLLSQRLSERRTVTFAIRLDRDGKTLAETTHPVQCLPQNAWIADRESWPYLPAYVLPFAAGTLDVVRESRDDLLADWKDPFTFAGYYGKDPDTVDAQARAVFRALQKKRITYMPPPGLPVYEPGNPVNKGQYVRLPDAIVAHKWGTCHDLALLFAACLEYLGIRPILVLVRGHTFVGYWRDPGAHATYWSRRSAFLKSDAPFGAAWMFRSRADFTKRVEDGSVQLVEATFAADETRTFEDAIGRWVRIEGERTLKELPWEAAIDVRAARPHVQPFQ